MSDISEDLRRKMLAAMDAPMTDLEAVQTVVAMFEAMASRMKVAPAPEQLTLISLTIRAADVIDHLRQRLNVAT